MACKFFVRFVPEGGVTAIRSVGFRRFVEEYSDSDYQGAEVVWVQPLRFSGELTNVTDRHAIRGWLFLNVGPGQIFETQCWVRSND